MKRKIVFTVACLAYATIIFAQPPNNAIFNGGIGDGWVFGSNNAVNNSIFNGGDGDGWHNESYLPATISIFSGGEGDGWHNESYLPATISIFSGGEGDGWHYSGFYPVPNSIFLGGAGDGWSFNNFNIAPNTIFYGGVGDGWSHVVYPMGPLPVTLLSFTGEQQGKTNLLKWVTSQEINTSHFELERSATANNFTGIKNVLAAGSSSSAKNYSSVDEFPLMGNNFYRLKMVDADGSFKYSNVVLLRVLDNAVVLSVFPNPVADKLNIAISNSNIISKLQLQVFDNAGKLITVQSVTNSNGISLNVSSYAAGVYLLKIMYNDKVETIRFVKAK